MNPKERGLAPFKAKIMDRFPMWYGAAPETTKKVIEYLGVNTEEEALYKVIEIDYKTIRPKYIGKPFKAYEDGTAENEWGVRRGGYHYGQPLTHPMKNIENVKEIEKYNFPNPDDWDVKIADNELEDAHDYCIIGAAWSPFFHDATELMGMERFFVEMYMNPGLIEAIIENVFNFYYEINCRTFATNPGVVDMLFIGNDFGAQKSLLFSPAMWRKYFRPYLAKFVDLAHNNGAVAAIHSCGDIHEIIPDLIDIGFDAINPIQVAAANMDPITLAREYGEDVVLFGGIDVNEVLAHYSEEEVRRETRKIIDILGGSGRYIVAPSHDYMLPELPAANIVAMYDEAKQYGTGT